MQAAVVGLALHELWISFRLLLVLGAFVAPGAVVALAPASVADAFDRMAIGSGLAGGLTTVVAAAVLAGERRRGTAAWLTARSVARRTLTTGWLIAIGLPALIGLAGGGLLTWLAVSTSPVAPEPGTLALVMVAVAVGTLEMVAVGLLLGALLPRLAAALAAAVVAAAVGAVSVGLPAWGAMLPAGGHLVLAGLPGEARPVADAIRATGVALAGCAAALVLARAAMERADL